MGLCLLGGNNCRHNKGVKTGSPIKLVLWGVLRALFLAIWNLENSIVLKTLQHFDVLGICISISVHLME